MLLRAAARMLAAYEGTSEAVVGRACILGSVAFSVAAVGHEPVPPHPE